MPKTANQNKEDFDLATLYPQLTPEEQQEAARNLDRYLGAIFEIFCAREHEKGDVEPVA